MGTKAAKEESKKSARKKKADGEGGIEKSAADMASSVCKLEQTFGDSQSKKADIMRKQVDLEERKLEWEMTKEMFGPHSTATDDERAQLEKLMRRNLLCKLQDASEDVRMVQGQR